jgi:hypothetical protein
MQIVIDIPESVIEHIKDGSFGARIEDRATLIDAVMNGTPLPKGHGCLIDVDDIALIDEQFYTPSDYYVAENAINEAPTIIEAESEDECSRNC